VVKANGMITEMDESCSGVLLLCDDFTRMNALRLDIDRRIMALPPYGHERDQLWQELEAVLASVSEVVGKLTLTPASDMAELRAKAQVLATLRQSGDAVDGPIMPEVERALALSLAHNTVELPGCLSATQRRAQSNEGCSNGDQPLSS
jgi:hypothetical protein